MKENRQYKEYLASEDWQEHRQNKVAQANGICDQCHWPLGNSTPHVHHKSYANLEHESFEDTSVLHSICHKRIHPHMKEVKEND